RTGCATERSCRRGAGSPAPGPGSPHPLPGATHGPSTRPCLAASSRRPGHVRSSRAMDGEYLAEHCASYGTEPDAWYRAQGPFEVRDQTVVLVTRRAEARPRCGGTTFPTI